MSTRNTTSGNNVNRLSMTKASLIKSYSDRDVESDAFVGASKQLESDSVTEAPLQIVSSGLLLRFDIDLPNAIVPGDYAANSSGTILRNFGSGDYEFLMFNGVGTSEDGNSLVFDAVDDYCRLAVSGNVSPDGGLPIYNKAGTISHWLNNRNPASIDVAFYMASGTPGFALNGFGGGNALTEIHTYTSVYSFNFNYNRASPDFNAIGVDKKTTYPKNIVLEWYEFTATWDEEGEIKLYVNGEFQGSTSMAEVDFADTIPNYVLLGGVGTIVNGNTWGRAWSGKMANVMFYDRALSGAEIANNYRATKHRFKRLTPY